MTQLTKKQLSAVIKQGQLPLDAHTAPVFSVPKETLSFSINLRAMGAVRQSRSDTWDPTEAVIRYRKWRDQLREMCGVVYLRKGKFKMDTRFQDCDEAWVVSTFRTSAEVLWGKLHKQTPDADNIYKAVTDALFVKDDGIAVCHSESRWGPEDKMEIRLVEVTR